MAKHGITVAEEAHVVNALPPVDVNGAVWDTDYFSLEKYQHATIILTLGVTGAATTVTVLEASDSSGTGATAIAFDLASETTAAGDTLGALTATASTGFATSTNDNITYVIEIDAQQLTDGKPWLKVHGTDPSAATLVSCVAVLSGARYQGPTTPTAIV